MRAQIEGAARSQSQSVVVVMDQSARLQSVMDRCGPAASRVVYDANLSSHPLDQIQCGVVFIHAFWAGTSHIALKQISDTLVRIDPDCRLAFIVCDIDEIQELPDCRNRIYGGDTTGGNGDVMWIANGVVMARHNVYRQCDFDTTTQGLLFACQA